MTDREKLLVANLLLAIEAEGKTHTMHFTISLPPKPGEWERCQQAIDLARTKARADLSAAIEVVRHLVVED